MDGESVNSANGNLSFSIPLVSRPGRNGLGISLALSYNSKFWDYYWNGALYAVIPESNSWVARAGRCWWHG
jgi:hypothetical protein